MSSFMLLYWFCFIAIWMEPLEVESFSIITSSIKQQTSKYIHIHSTMHYGSHYRPHITQRCIDYSNSYPLLTMKDKNYEFALSSSMNDDLIGEDSAAFNLENESLKSWLTFLVAVSGVMSVVFYSWIYDSGLHWGDQFKSIMESISGGDSTLAITYMLGVFAVSHSGLASLRPYAENIVGARVWRYVFALVSLPLAFSCITYFINHR